MIENIVDAFIYKGPSQNVITDEEKEIYDVVKNQFKNDLYPDQNNTASDVYGGVTINQLKGRWAHHEDDYWIDEETGKRINEPNKEGFANYYGNIMIEDNKFREETIKNVEEYLPNSKQHMDDMFDSMSKGEE